MITDLAILKEHLRASAEIQNGLIVLYAEAVEERLTAFLDRPVYADAALIPAPVTPTMIRLPLLRRAPSTSR